MELLLIRHALPVRMDDVEGGADPHLSDIGIRQSELLGEYLRDEDIAAVYSSPMRRAAETAAVVASALGIDVVHRDGLAESDRGSVSYVPMEELRDDDDERWHKVVERMRARECCTEEELEFRRVVVGAVEEIIAAHSGERVVAVCHAGVINAYFGAINEIDRPLWFEPGYTSVNRLLASRWGDRGIGSLNELAHLRQFSRQR